MTGHTPGLWLDREGTTTGAEVFAKKPRGGDYVVARCGGKDRKANARLIAAAPELLEALQQMTARLELYAGKDDALAGFHDKAVLKAARAAIAKASPHPPAGGGRG